MMNQQQRDEWNRRRELRLRSMTYEEAAHAIQSGIATRMSIGQGRDTEPKHLRVGIDLSKTDNCGLAKLLMDKGVFTMEEYLEAIRISAIEEVQRLEEQLCAHFGQLPTLI